ncbi:MAG: lipocalin family protein [Gemmatimonadales bacterium]|jgi:hypothetical protein|nr:lipocalin family protein [Gemmatimonadales bacterium]
MRSTLWLAALPALMWASASCGDSTAVDPQSLLGTWDATKLEFTRVANTSDKVDLIDLGGEFVITLAANDVCTGTFTVPGELPENLTGTWSVSVDVFTLHWDGDTGNTQFDMTLSGNTLTLTGGDVDYDFGNGDEAAKLTVVLDKR